MDNCSSSRSKTFVSLDSLWYEEERLATFIDWPLKFVSPQDLAAHGFYYLRSHDHCACAFCRGIIGSWEEGDTPEQEHKRHFPGCPFVKGLPTPNVSIKLGKILSKCDVTPRGRLPSSGQDVCGPKDLKDPDSSQSKPVVLPAGKTINSSELSSIGLQLYSGPKKKDFITYEARLDTFKNWPHRVTQKPQDLADAGFYYCGVSDHVRCFHCGSGLRNWEAEDDPWNEHARWYPDCNFVLLTKGIDFIDKVRREKPPYMRTCANPSSCTASSKLPSTASSLTESELDKLLELPVIKSVLSMGFDKHAVKTVLRRKLEQTGVPFFSTEGCIEAVLQLEATHSSLSNSENVAVQERKLQAIQNSDSTLAPVSASSLSSGTEPHSSTQTAASPADPLTTVVPVLPSLPNLLHASPPLRSSTPTSQIESLTSSMPQTTEDESSQQTPSPLESSTVLSNSSEDVVSDRISIPSPSATIVPPETLPVMSSPTSSLSFTQTPHSQVHSFNSELTSINVDPLVEAEHIIKEATKLLGSKSGEPTEAESPINEDKSTYLPEQSEDPIKDEVKLSSTEADKLAEELEKLRECRMCRICMDKEMDIVFLPCTHMVTCSACAVALSACPICRSRIQYAFKPIIT